jgi:hypothetical protein
MNNARLCKHLGQQAIARVNTHFTWATVAEQLETLYRQIVEESRVATPFWQVAA